MRSTRRAPAAGTQAGLILASVGAALVMVVLDVSIVHVAPPSTADGFGRGFLAASGVALAGTSLVLPLVRRVRPVAAEPS